MKYIAKKLNNGTKLLIVSDKKIKEINISLTIKAGSLNETTNNNGVAHLIEHLILPTTETNHGANLKTLENLNAELDLSIDKQHIYLNAIFANRNLSKTLAYIKDTVFDLKFSEKDLKREKKIVSQEIDRAKNDLIYQIEQLADKNIFKYNHGLKLPLLGGEKIIKNINKKQILHYYNQQYIPANTTLAIATNKSKTEILKTTEKIFSSMPKLEPIKTKSQQTKKQSIKIKSFNRNNRTYIKIDFNSFSINATLEEKICQQLIAEYLTESQSSPLIQTLRAKRNLIYDIYTDIQYYDQTGIFSIVTDTDKESYIKVIEIIIEELDNLKRGKIYLPVLNQTKQYLNRKNLEATQDLETRVNWLKEETLIYGKLKNSPQKVINTRDKISNKYISDIAKRIFNPINLHISVLGPADKEKIMKILNNTTTKDLN